MKYLPESEFDEIHFFGDKYFDGGNDKEIYNHPRTIGHAITEVRGFPRIHALDSPNFDELLHF